MEGIQKQFVVGVDIGGQTSKIGLVDARGEVLFQNVIRTDVYGEDAERYIKDLAEAIKACVKQAGKTLDRSAASASAPRTATIIPVRSPSHPTSSGRPAIPWRSPNC